MILVDQALLESMAHAKLNVLHWHLVDSEVNHTVHALSHTVSVTPSPQTPPIPPPTLTPTPIQSFPFESRAYPKLWDGAFTPDERYLQEEVAAIVEFARLRGIRVVPEFDVVRACVLLCLVPCVCVSSMTGSVLAPFNFN